MSELRSNEFLVKEKPGKLMRKYAIPCIISLVVAALYNIVDQIYIANADYLGSFGNAANTTGDTSMASILPPWVTQVKVPAAGENHSGASALPQTAHPIKSGVYPSSASKRLSTTALICSGFLAPVAK